MFLVFFSLTIVDAFFNTQILIERSGLEADINQMAIAKRLHVKLACKSELCCSESEG